MMRLPREAPASPSKPAPLPLPAATRTNQGTIGRQDRRSGDGATHLSPHAHVDELGSATDAHAGPGNTGYPRRAGGSIAGSERHDSGEDARIDLDRDQDQDRDSMPRVEAVVKGTALT